MFAFALNGQSRMVFCSFRRVDNLAIGRAVRAASSLSATVNPTVRSAVPFNVLSAKAAGGSVAKFSFHGSAPL